MTGWALSERPKKKVPNDVQSRRFSSQIHARGMEYCISSMVSIIIAVTEELQPRRRGLSRKVAAILPCKHDSAIVAQVEPTQRLLENLDKESPDLLARHGVKPYDYRNP